MIAIIIQDKQISPDLSVSLKIIHVHIFSVLNIQFDFFYNILLKT